MDVQALLRTAIEEFIIGDYVAAGLTLATYWRFRSEGAMEPSIGGDAAAKAVGTLLDVSDDLGVFGVPYSQRPVM